VAGQAARRAGQGHVQAPRPPRGQPASRTVRVDAVAGHGVALTGQISAAILEHVRGGEPLILRRGRRVAAVLLDPDTFAELAAIADDLLAVEGSASSGRP